MKIIILPFLAMVTPSFVQAQSTVDWTGWHGGVQLDVMTGGDFDYAPSSVVSGDWTGALYGLHAGYRREFLNVVIAGEYDLAFGGTSNGSINAAGASLIDVTARPTVHRFAGELGIAVDRFLPYATAGFTHLSLDSEAGRNYANGFFAGVGIDYQYRDGLTVGIEALSHDYGEFSLSPDFQTEFSTLSVNWGVRF